MSGPAVTKRTLGMVEAYEAGATLAEVGKLYGISKQRAHTVIKLHAPVLCGLKQPRDFRAPDHRATNSTPWANVRSVKYHCIPTGR